MRFTIRPKAEQRTEIQLGIDDPALAEYLGIGMGNYAGETITETGSLELSAVWRSVLLISGTIAGLPLKSYRMQSDGTKKQIETYLDWPNPDMTPFEWVELIMGHELLWGNSFLMNILNGAGAVAGLAPLAPWTPVKRDKETGIKLFSVRGIDGNVREFTSVDVLHIPSFNTDGLKGISPIGMARHSLGTAKAGERAAGRMWANGLLLGGVLKPIKEALTKSQKEQVLKGLKGHSGAENAGDVAFIPAPVEFSPWTMNPIDAQFLEGRHFGIEECSRWFGVPRELLSESGASSWGSGIQEIVRGFGRFCLSNWTTRLQQRLSMTLPKKEFCEFDYSKFLQPSPEEEIRLLIEQVNAKLLTIDEARAIRNLGPMPKEETNTEGIEVNADSTQEG